MTDTSEIESPHAEAFFALESLLDEVIESVRLKVKALDSLGGNGKALLGDMVPLFEDARVRVEKMYNARKT